MNNSKENKESSRQFIDFSRKILTTQIAINDKSDENHRLMEYITMEQEKIEIARRGIEEDREKFDKIMNDSERNVKQTTEKVKKAEQEKNRL